MTQDIDKIRSEAGLPVFSTDIFISWKFTAHSQKCSMLDAHCRKWRATTKVFTAAQMDVDEAQIEEIEKSRIAVFLLESKGMNNGSRWGQQYKELLALADAMRRLEDEFPESARYAHTIPIVVHFFDSSDDHAKKRDQTVDALFPSRAMLSEDDSRPSAPGYVRTLLKDRVAWIDVDDTTALSQDANWPDLVWQSIISHCRQANRVLQNGQPPIDYTTPEGLALANQQAIPAAEAAPERKAAQSSFDPVGYINKNRTLWVRGFISNKIFDPAFADEELDLQTSPESRIELKGQVLEREGAETVLKPVEDVAATLADSDVSILLLGQPGAGKTTMLTQAAHAEGETYRQSAQFAEETTDKKSLPRCPLVLSIPKVYAALSDPATSTGASSLISIIAEQIEGSGVTCSEKDLQDFLQGSPCTFYFDGLDEISITGRRRFVHFVDELRGGLNEQSRIVVSCRQGYEEDYFNDCQVLLISSLTSEDVDEFASRSVVAKALDGVQRFNYETNFRKLNDAIFDAGEATGILRTPFMLSLLSAILQRDNAIGALEGAGGLIYSRLMSGLFDWITKRVPEADAEDFDPVTVLTDLAYHARVKNGSLTSARIFDSVREGTSHLPRQEAEKLRQRRSHFLRFGTMVLQPEGNKDGVFTFSHSIFAEYLLAVGLAKRFVAFRLGNIDDAATVIDKYVKTDGDLKTLLFGSATELKEDATCAALIDQIAFAFLDIAIFPQLSDDQASDIMVSFAEMISNMLVETAWATPAQQNLATRLTLQFIRAVGGVSDLLMPAARLKCFAYVLRVYRSRRPDFTPLQRDRILTSLGNLDIAGAGLRTPLERLIPAFSQDLSVAAGEYRVPVWSRDEESPAQINAFGVLRHPVTVGQYRLFAEAPDRYNHEFWPFRTSDERRKADRTLIPVAQAGQDLTSGGVKLRDCIIADVEQNRDVRLHWEEQKRHPFRPVTNVTWREAVAFALWRSKRDGKAYRLPGALDWSVLAGLAAKPASPEDDGTKNVRSALIHRPSTIGVFPPSATGLLDFGSNVSAWLSDFNPETWETIWPPVECPDFVHWIGPNYLDHDDRVRLDRAPTPEVPEERARYIGIWLVYALD